MIWDSAGQFSPTPPRVLDPSRYLQLGDSLNLTLPRRLVNSIDFPSIRTTYYQFYRFFINCQYFSAKRLDFLAILQLCGRQIDLPAIPSVELATFINGVALSVTFSFRGLSFHRVNYFSINIHQENRLLSILTCSPSRGSALYRR